MTSQTIQYLFSEGEIPIRSYQCTKLKRLFAKPVYGFITVTNKRVIYYSEENTLSGNSAVINEMPIEDVAGISSSLISMKSWFWIPIVFVVLLLANQLLGNILPGWLSHWLMAILLMLPFIVQMLFEKNIIKQQVSGQIQQSLANANMTGILKIFKTPLAYTIIQVLFFFGLAVFLWNVNLWTISSRGAHLLYYLVLVGITVWIYLSYFKQKLAFSLVISSRTAKGAGIQVSGDLLSLIGAGFNSVLQSMNSGAGDHAEWAIKQLGAMILDLQQMGDLGIQKWKTG